MHSLPCRPFSRKRSPDLSQFDRCWSWFASFATFGQSQYRSTVTWTRNFSSFGLDFAEAASEFNVARARLATRKCHGSVNGFAVEIIADFRLVRAINGRWKLLCKETILSFAFLGCIVGSMYSWKDFGDWWISLRELSLRRDTLGRDIVKRMM